MAGLGQDKMETEHVTLGAQVYPRGRTPRRVYIQWSLAISPKG